MFRIEREVVGPVGGLEQRIDRQHHRHLRRVVVADERVPVGDVGGAVEGRDRRLAVIGREDGQRGRHDGGGEGGLEERSCHVRVPPTQSYGRRTRLDCGARATPKSRPARRLGRIKLWVACVERRFCVLRPPWRPCPLPAAAQTSKERPFIQAAKVETGPRIDGVLDDAAWQTATPVESFTQQEPNLGQPATERTEVRIVYDARTIYIAVHAYQSGGVVPAEPGPGADPHAEHRGDAGAGACTVVATEMRRDSDRLFDEDNFQVILDTFKDSRNGYMFVTTPLGAKLEQQIFDEGEGGGRGTTSNVNRNWEGVWDAAAQITADGWTAEMAIPTNTLRFQPTDEQTWGINFLRHIRRKNELDYWAPIPRAYTLTRVEPGR